MSQDERPRKLIEVALPLDEINAACKADKDRKTGTIRNIHKWFAPMPLPAWRALLYAALIDDPDDDEKRAYHLDLIKRLVKNGADLPDAEDMAEAQENLNKQFPDGVPTVMDPFCGGGSTLVEAQRLGLPTFGSDLNPVPVLITRTLTELLPKVYGQQPLHPEAAGILSSGKSKGKQRQEESKQEPLLEIAGGKNAMTYEGYDGLIRDVTYYAEQIRDNAWEQLKAFYPSQPGETPIAWLWGRTAKCPNPACGLETVLTTTWALSSKSGDLAWIEPKVLDGRLQLNIVSGQSSGKAPPPPKSVRGASFSCVACNATLGDTELENQSDAGTLGYRLLAVAVESAGKRLYRAVTDAEIEAALAPDVSDSQLDQIPVTDGTRRRRFEPSTQAQLYTSRQLVTLVTLADQVSLVRDRVVRDGGSQEWADAVATLLGLAVGRRARYGSSQSQWRLRSSAHAKAESAFSRNDIPMMWDFAETFFMSGSVGDWREAVASTLTSLVYAVPGSGRAERQDARVAALGKPGLVATDPPYFDAIGYADLSDYFYVWHRRSLRHVHPDLYATVAAPKQGELTAFPSHHGDSKEAARKYFVEGFTQTFVNLQRSMDPSLPMIVVYASKEQKAGSGEETRWEAILTAMIQAELEITGTWPVHGTGSTRMRGIGSNAVATYVAMVCRPRGSNAGICTLADFNRALRSELKPAVENLQAAGILPVDMAQAAMGPGMQVYSRYRKVVDQSGDRVPVGQALRLINQALTEVLQEQEGELDPVSRFAIALWEKHHWDAAPFDAAERQARPRNLSVDEVVRSGVLAYPKPGFVVLLGEDELDRNWTPGTDTRPTAWEAVHHLAERLINGGGVEEAGALMAALGELRDPAQALVYSLHAIAARQGWTADQERYNSLIASWSDLLAEAGRVHESGDGLF